jgi:glycine betaine catabolism B
VPTTSLELPPTGLSTRLGFDPRFTRIYVAVLGAVPAAQLAWDAVHGHLPANGVNFAIRTLGLMGLIFLTSSLAVTPLRRLTGWNLLVATRRSLGLLGFSYICVHVLVFFWFDRMASVSGTAEEIVKRFYLTLGALALVLMIPLALTSTDAWVSRLGPRRWKALHRLAYIVGILGVVHFWLLVKSDIRQPRAFAIVVGALLAARIAWHYLDLRRAVTAARARRPAAVPSMPAFWKGELRVTRIFQETPDVKTFRLTPVAGGNLPFTYKPGQYLNLALTIGDRPTRRSYTMASSPTRVGFVEITVKRVPDGWASHHLHDTWHEGSVVKVSAPAGKFHFLGTGSDRVLLLAGGVGITPLMSMVRALTDRSWAGQIHLVYSVRKPEDVIFGEELASLSSRFPNLHLCLSASGQVNGAWAGERGRVDAAMLARRVPGLASMPVYLCGPTAMIDTMRPLLVGLGVTESAIHTEAFVSPASGAPAEALADGGQGDLGTAEPEDAGSPEGLEITFSRSAVQVPVADGQTVLDAAEANGIELRFECRSGICGQCKVRLASGRVRMDAQDALSPEDRKDGVILACQAHARTALTIEA